MFYHVKGSFFARITILGKTLLSIHAALLLSRYPRFCTCFDLPVPSLELFLFVPRKNSPRYRTIRLSTPSPLSLGSAPAPGRIQASQKPVPSPAASSAVPEPSSSTRSERRSAAHRRSSGPKLDSPTGR